MDTKVLIHSCETFGGSILEAKTCNLQKYPHRIVAYLIINIWNLLQTTLSKLKLLINSINKIINVYDCFSTIDPTVYISVQSRSISQFNPIRRFNYFTYRRRILNVCRVNIWWSWIDPPSVLRGGRGKFR